MSKTTAFLPKAQYTTQNNLLISATAKEIFPYLEHLDFSEAKITYWLFKLRGIPVPTGMSLKGLQGIGFVLIESVPNESVTLGLIGKYWTLNGALRKFNPSDFLGFHHPDYAKAVWQFRILSESETSSLLITETRIECMSKQSLKRFSRYWLFIKPFSSFIRQELLHAIRRRVMRGLQTKVSR